MDNHTEGFVLDSRMKTESQLQVLLIFAILSNKKLAEKLSNNSTNDVIAELSNAPALNFPTWFLSGEAIQIVDRLSTGLVGKSPVTGPISEVANYLGTEPYPDPGPHANVINSILARL